MVTVDPWSRRERVKMSPWRAEEDWEAEMQRPRVTRAGGAEAEDEGAAVETQKAVDQWENEGESQSGRGLWMTTAL